MALSMQTKNGLKAAGAVVFGVAILALFYWMILASASDSMTNTPQEAPIFNEDYDWSERKKYTPPSIDPPKDGSDLSTQKLLKTYEGGDYQNVVQEMALAPEVQRSHKKYIKDIHRRTTGASVQTIRSDPNFINKPVGIAGFQAYFRATKGATVAKDARVVPSEFAEQTGGYRPFVA